MQPLNYSLILLFLFLDAELTAGHKLGYCLEDLEHDLSPADLDEITGIYAELPYSYWM